MFCCRSLDFPNLNGITPFQIFAINETVSSNRVERGKKEMNQKPVQPKHLHGNFRKPLKITNYAFCSAASRFGTFTFFM